jgi:hypothetical protein
LDGPDAAGRERGEEEIWRDLVARLDPGLHTDDAGPRVDAPWPAEEDLDVRPSGARVVKPADPDDAAAGPGPAFSAEPPTAASAEPPMAVPAESDEHYIPPPPPPLPHLDPVTKGAWLALFGGPAYLLVATVAGWAIPAWAAFCGVAAFIGGFILLVVRMSDEDRGDDDGAVV